LIKQIIKSVVPYRIYYPLVSLVRYLASYYKYSGNRFYCSICRSSFSTFFEFGFSNPTIEKYSIVGAGLSPYGTCPRCLSNDRERHVFLYLQKHHPELFIKQLKMLHIAPEKNLWELFRRQKNIDYIPAGLDMQLASVNMDITNISEGDNSFDVVICNHVLEHIVDDVLAMSELFRVMKQGGFAILQVPISFVIDKTIEDSAVVDPNERREKFGQSDHVRIYGIDYISRLESVGFSVEMVDFVSEFSADEVERYSLIPEEKIFVCRK